MAKPITPPGPVPQPHARGFGGPDLVGERLFCERGAFLNASRVWVRGSVPCETKSRKGRSPDAAQHWQRGRA